MAHRPLDAITSFLGTAVRSPRARIGLPLACFSVHLALITFHTFFVASRFNTRPVPRPPSYYGDETLTPWSNVLDLNRFDSIHYQRIVRGGYPNPPGTPNVIIWFPGYPLLARAIHAVTGWPIPLVFSLLSATFTLAFWFLLWSAPMVAAFGRKTLVVASALTTLWPGAFFWFDGMTEPLVAFLLLAVIAAWVARRRYLLAAVLAFATAVKQVFLPVAAAVVLLEWVRTRPRPARLALQGVAAISGFLAFAAFSWARFGDPFASFNVSRTTWEITVSPFSLVDVQNYVRSAWSLGGLTANASMLILLLAGALLAWPAGLRGLGRLLRGPRPELSIEVVVWALAFTCTAFYVIGDAHYATRHAFSNLFRYQSTNVPGLLLIASLAARIPTRKLASLLLAVAPFLLFFQGRFTTDYWWWRWVA